MVTMRGRRWTDHNTTFYKTWEQLPNGSKGFRICNDCSLGLIGAVNANRPLLAWGYVGLGPDLTSAGLIGLTICDQIPVEEWYYRHTYTRDYATMLKGCGVSWCMAHGCILSHLSNISDWVIPYYRDFTKEHTSKWGDEWTMTSDEVMAWLVSKGYKQKEKVVR